jgi:hypothetical protein
MTENELKLYVVGFVILLFVWTLWFMRRSGMLESTKIFEKARFAWQIYLEAKTLDQKVVAAAIAFFVMTHSFAKSVFGLLFLFVTLTIGGVFNNTVWQFLVDFAKYIVHLVHSPSQSVPA